MRPILALLTCAALGACTAATVTKDLSTPSGQLFCAIATGGGDTIVSGLIDAAASAGGAGPVAVIATGATSATVQADCAAAAAAVGGTAGVPVSPPAAAATAPTVAIVVPKAS